MDPFGQGIYGGGVKIDIGDGGEQALHQQQSLFRGRGAALTDELPGIGNERSGQPVLRVGRLGGLAADSGCTGARGAVRGLLALKTKHLVHLSLSFCVDGESVGERNAVYAGEPSQSHFVRQLSRRASP